MSPLSPDVLEKARIPPVWIVMPILAGRDVTLAAIADCLAQSVAVRLLLINQGVEDAFRAELEQIAEQDARVLLWSHVPPLLSLAATWNCALQAVWGAGAPHALVVNNDVRLHPQTVQTLCTVLVRTGALFVSAVGVTAEQFEAAQGGDQGTVWEDVTTPVLNNVGIVPLEQRGGPDFSCFLISRACHERFQFDENFVPAFCEDLDYHRRLMLAGEGQRIFSVNLPYLHYASATLKTLPEQEAARVRQQIETVSRAYYARKWGGPVNGETFVLPFRQTEDRDVSTPALQKMIREDRAHELPRVDPVWLGQQGNHQPKSTVLRDPEPE